MEVPGTRLPRGASLTGPPAGAEAAPSAEVPVLAKRSLTASSGDTLTLDHNSP